MREIVLHKQGNTDCNIQIELADSFWQRFFGLMGRNHLSHNRGLLIKPCNSVHMCFMRFPIDVVYLVPDTNGYRVKKVVSNLRPWLGLSACWRANCTLELAAGAADEYGIVAGDILTF